MRLVAFWVATSFWVALMRYKPGALVATLGKKCNIPKFCDCDCNCDVIVIYCICFALQLVLALSALDLHLGSILFDLQDLAAGTFAGKLLNISIV